MHASHRCPVAPDKAYRLLNHGPTVLVSAAHAGKRNIMAAAVGSSAGKSLNAEGIDKFDAYGLHVFQGEASTAPLIEGCVAWLECRLYPEPHIQQTYDLFLGEILFAQADERVFSNGRWHFEGQDALRTIHHVAGGHFITAGPAIDAVAVPRIR